METQESVTVRREAIPPQGEEIVIPIPGTLTEWRTMTKMVGLLSAVKQAELLRSVLASPLAAFLSTEERDLCEARAVCLLSASGVDRYLQKKEALGLNENSVMPWTPEILETRINQATVSYDYQAKVNREFKVEGRGVYRWMEIKQDPSNPTRFFERKTMKVGLSRESLPAVPGRLLWHLSISKAKLMPTHAEIVEARLDLLPKDLWMVQVMPPVTHNRGTHPFCVDLWESPEALLLAPDRGYRG